MERHSILCIRVVNSTNDNKMPTLQVLPHILCFLNSKEFTKLYAIFQMLEPQFYSGQVTVFVHIVKSRARTRT